MLTNAEEYSAHTWVVIVGVSAYSSEQLAFLPSPARDAEELRRALVDETGCAIPPAQVAYLTDNTSVKAGKQQIKTALENVVERAGSKDIIVFYFAGHGLQDGSHFYLCAADTDLSALEKTAISSSELDVIFQNAAARGVFVILDCCQSAAFADLAPNFFRRLDTGDFRILLSASRAKEPSWELPDSKGTLFTHHLLQIVRGNEQVSSTQGIIYFSELLQHIQNQVAEDLEKWHPGAPIQEPVFAGVYAKDPLLFVHKRLTLKQVSIKVTRYSREYIRRLVTRLAVSALLVMGFALGNYYAVLDNYEYVVAEADGLTVYRGYPGYNVAAFGFPRKMWTFDIQAEDTVPHSPLRQNGSIVSSLGKPVLPGLMENLSPEYRALLLHWQGDDAEARLMLKAYFANAESLSEKSLGEAAELFAKIAVEEDASLLRTLAESPVKNVKINAVKGLIRLSPTSGIELAMAQRDPGYAGPVPVESTQAEIVNGLTGSCRAEFGPYFSNLLHRQGATYTQSCVIDAALRLGCDLSTSDLVQAQLNRAPSQDNDIGMYAALKGKDDLTASLLSTLKDRANSLEVINNALLMLGVLPGDTCDPTVWSYLDHDNPVIRRLAAMVLLNRCKDFSAKFADTGFQPALKTDSSFIAEMARKRLVDWRHVISVIDATSNAIEKSSLLDAIKHVASPETVPVIINILNNQEEYYLVKMNALMTLRELHVPPDVAPSLFRDTAFAVQREAYLWYRIEHPRETVAALMTRFNEKEIEYIPEVLGTMTLTQAELDAIRLRLGMSSNPPELRNAVIIIAMQGDVKEVQTLLHRKEKELRKLAADYAAFNRNFDAICQNLETHKSYPDGACLYLKEQQRLKEEIYQEMKTTPQLAAYWRAGLIANVRAVSPGLKLWLAELTNRFVSET